MNRIAIAAGLLAAALAWRAGSQPPDLDARVRQLIEDTASAPATRANIAARAEVLDDWSDRLSLAGAAIPQELTSTVALVKSGQQRLTDQQVAGVDHFVRELALKQQHPNGLGIVRAGPLDGPLVVDTWNRVEIVYTAGDVPISAGGSLLLGKHFGSDHGLPQVRNPRGANFVSVRCSDPSVRLRIGEGSRWGVHGSFRVENPVVLPKITIEEGSLDKGESITLVIGDRSGGGPGFRVQTVTNDRFILPLYVDFDGRGTSVYLENPGMQVVGGAPAALSMVVPSIVDVGEKFPLRFRIEDSLMNPAGGPSPALDIFLDGKLFRAVETGRPNAFSIEDVSIEAEGAHYFTARSREGSIQGAANPVLVRRKPVNRIYWGEMHGHTGFADGQGTEDGYFRFGRDFAYLDFCTLSEHDLWMTRHQWRAIAEAAKKYNDPGRFITFKSYEWTGAWTVGGHHNVYFRDDDGRTAGIREGASDITKLYQMLKRTNDPRGVLVVPHCHNSGTWLITDRELQNLVEIYSFHGSFEYYGNKFLARGEPVGVIAASDHHQGHPGYARAARYTRGGLAAVVAAKLNRNTIFDAMKTRATYATSGERIVIDFTLNGQPMGARAPSSPSRLLKAQVAGTAPLDRIEVVRNGRTIYGQDLISGEMRGTLQAQVLFRSASNPPTEELDIPRGARPWNGKLRVVGARLAGVTGIHLDRLVEKAWKQEGNEVAFALETRGDSDGFLLSLEEAGAATSIEVELEAAREGIAAGGSRYQPRGLEAQSVKLPFNEVKGGRLVRDVGSDEFRDTVSLQLLRERTSRAASFQYSDTAPGSEGDYYYLRVTQADGEQAWTSPVWVGGRGEEITTEAQRTQRKKK